MRNIALVANVWLHRTLREASAQEGHWLGASQPRLESGAKQYD
jgi:hypothetical protein